MRNRLLIVIYPIDYSTSVILVTSLETRKQFIFVINFVAFKKPLISEAIGVTKIHQHKRRAILV